MSKKAPKRRAKQQKQQPVRKTNWTLIGGIVAAGIIGLFGLLYLALQEPETITLSQHCASNPDSCIAKGEANAPVTIVEVLDFGCPHCRNFHVETAPQIDAAYVDTGIVQFISFPYALSNQTMPAANATMCAQDQNNYFEYADALFSNFDDPDNLSRVGLLQAAESLSLEMDRFTACVDSNQYVATIEDNIDVARRQRIASTPTFTVNGRQVQGARPFADFQREIELALN